MKAIRVHELGDPEVMKYEEVDKLVPAAGQVLIDVKAIGVNPVETYIRSGNYPVQPELPYVPGMDAAGVVEVVGAGVKGLKKGDRVYTAGTLTGSYAEKMLCEKEQVFLLPENVSFEQGAAISIPYGTADYALFARGEAVQGETVLIHGASGAVGIAALQLACAAGLTVMATAGSEEGMQLLRDQGANYVFNHYVTNYTQEIFEATGGQGVHLILEMLANVNLAKDLELLAPKGRVMVIGCRGEIFINPRLLMGKGSDIRGVLLFHVQGKEKRDMYRRLGKGLEKGDLKPFVGKKFALKDAAAAHHEIMEKPAFGKMILCP